MLKVIINAYACSPDMGSEPGMGWNWCMNLAKYCELFIITEGEFRDRIEHTVPMLPQGANMHFYYNPVPERVRQMCWNQGDWRFYKYYKDWQKKTADIAREICKKEEIDILHQLNMIGFREPGYLWQVSRETGIPFVWGPVDAKESFPMAYANGASIKTKFFLLLKNIITKCQLRYSKRVHEAVKTASLVLSASSNSVVSFNKYFGIESPLMNETGTYPIENQNNSSDKKSSFDILWVGKTDFRKQLTLAIKSVAAAYHHDIKLHIVGAGDMQEYLKVAESVGIADNCIVHGSISHDEVLRLMRDSDLFLFTSVAEGTPHVVLEAIGCGLPVLCFDTCGQGDCVNDEVGIKIPLSNPKQSEKAFAEKIEYFHNNRDALNTMKVNCFNRARELTWDKKAQKLSTEYNKLPPPDCEFLEIIWVGKFDFRKQLLLALDIIKMLKSLPVRLHVLGTGQNSSKYEQYAKDSAIADKIVWHGQVAHEEVNELMRLSHLFLFTSVMEGTSTVIMEALQNNLPVICFDACGMSAVINEDIGYKLPLTNPKQSVIDFAEKIEFLWKHRDTLARMSDNCKKRAEELSWDNKAKYMLKLYKDVETK